LANKHTLISFIDSCDERSKLSTLMVAWFSGM